jgi:hypothetical protein
MEAHPEEPAAARGNLQVAAAILWVIALVQFKMENVSHHKVFPIQKNDMAADDHVLVIRRRRWKLTHKFGRARLDV